MSRKPHPFASVVFARTSDAARSWLFERRAELDAASFGAAFAGAGRRLGDAPVWLTAGEQEAIVEAGLPVPEGWRLCDVGRGLLLLEFTQTLASERQLSFVEQQFRQGDNREREALLKVLGALPDPERFVAVAVDACRSNVQSVFEAIACENAYPARYFSDLAFNQLVLKAFFTEVQVRRISGLAQRVTPELSRMARDYASERRAAGRSVPADLGLVTLG